MSEITEALDETGLVYTSDTTPGISRKALKASYAYYSPSGAKITDENTLARIKSLVIPPAWKEVWISPKPKGHLQATGIDAAGRKQYKYHPEWIRSRNITKYYRLLEFGKQLPVFRRNIQKDLRRKNLDERKVLAISVNMMQKTLIRVGNESYKQLYGSYGLTTLRDKHVKINGNQLRLTFIGKKGVAQDIVLKDSAIARLVKKCRDIPGQELFQYYHNDGTRGSIDSGKINNYIKEVACCDFTAKDFRTWSGTLEMFRQLARSEYPETITKRKKVINEALDLVAMKLGNTRAVCRKSYIFPALIDQYENDELRPYLKKISSTEASVADKGLNHDEKVLLSFLKTSKQKESKSLKKRRSS